MSVQGEARVVLIETDPIDPEQEEEGPEDSESEQEDPETEQDDKLQGVQKVTRSGRISKPSLKLRERKEDCFWGLIKDVRHVIRRLDRDLTSDCPVSLKLQMEQEVKHAIEDVEIEYQQLRSALQSELPPSATQATDRSIEDLKRLAQRLRQDDNAEWHSTPSKSSSSSSRKSQIAAKTAVLQVELEAKRIEGQQRLELARLEAKENARKAEIDLEIQQKKQEIEDNKIQMEIKKAEAEMAALDTSTAGSLYGGSHHVRQNTSSNANNNSINNNNNTSIINNNKTSSNNNMDLAQALADTLKSSRLPPTEPFVFSGNPTKYPAWKTSFNILVVQKGVPANEKILYIRKYLEGEALEAVDGLLNLSTEDAYQSTIKKLDQRYGNVFAISEGFRDRIYDWPKISSGDSKGLRRFSDFLDQCLAATTEIPGLAILNDCRENRSMLQKLPDWIVRKWSRTITEYSEKGTYPSFACFVDFLAKEAQIACNPIVASLKETHMKTQKTRPLKKTPAANTFAVNKPPTQQAHQTSRKTSQPVHVARSQQEIPQPIVKTQPVAQQAVKTQSTVRKALCLFCKRTSHTIDMCRDFTKGTPEQRRDFIMSGGLCFSCLTFGHPSRNCKDKLTCVECKRKHPTSLCGDYEALHNGTTEDRRVEETGVNLKVITTNHSSPSSMVVPVYVSTNKKPQEEILVYALLDTQSDTSFISNTTLDKLDTTKTPTKLKLTTMTNTSLVESNRVQNLLVRGMRSSTQLKLSKVYSRDNILCNLGHIPTKEVTTRWPHLSQLSEEIPERQNCDVGLLIGYDCPQALAPLQVIRGEGNQPFGIETELGWSIVGKVICSEEDEDEACIHKIITKIIPDKLLIPQPEFQRKEVVFVHKVTTTEASPSDILKIMESDFKEERGESTASQEDLRFIRTLEDGICKDPEGYYQMPLPFREDRPILPDSRHMARKRLESLRRRLKNNEDYAKDYKKFMRDILEHGDAEEVQREELEDPRSWYIPHHGVYHPKKPQKIRVVFDCSAQSRGTCLNNHLLQGPELMNSLTGVLCRFRQEPIAVMGDIERMFHQFRVDPMDRNYLRFLWWKDGELDVEPTVYRMKVHLFGATSSPGCANYGLKKIAADNKHDSPKAADFIAHSFYVDDGLGSFNDENEAIDLLLRVRKLCQKGNLRFHKIMSNNPAVMESIPESEKAAEIKTRSFDETPVGRVLGIEWTVDSDKFQFRLNIPVKPLTRRGVLSTVASIYDPLGFLAPFQLLGKQLLQKLCQENCKWDDELPEDLRVLWERWMAELPKLANMKIRRCLIPDKFGKIKSYELHHFSDASFNGYGQCTYLRITNEDNDVYCSLVMGKSRVAPRKIVTIPRLELTAAVTSVKISNFLRNELTYKKIQEYFWTDSKIVLGYIRNEARRFHVFVANRVQRIRDNSEPHQWRYVTTQENTADYASRGMYADELINSNWLTGPAFLWKSELTAEEVIDEQVSSSDPEVKQIIVHTAKVQREKTVLERLECFSDWNRAVSAITVILTCVHKKIRKKSEDPRQEAETKIIRMIQSSEFVEEIQTIMKKKTLPRGNRLIQLDPFIDEEGIMRVGGRLNRSSYPLQIKHPIILPKSGHLVGLLIRKCHEKVAHQGRGFTTNELRSRGYWVLGCCRAVASYIFTCVTCRRLRGLNQGQKMANLPAERLEATPPFTHCGIDCFGPFIVKEGRREMKRYGLIITCMASRAVHVELLDDMTTDAFINGLRCFMALRGPVQTIRSDQGSNFVGAERELREALREIKDDQLRKFLGDNQCRFIMNSPHSSHMGGSWERHIRTIRSVLSTMLHQHSGRLDTSTLRTFLYEATAIVNSRPLTPCDLNDPQTEPLTPNHLLMMKTKIVLSPPGNFVKEDLYARRRWRKVQYLAEEFWKQWKKSYLITLQSRQKWHKEKRNFKIGDLVLLKDEEQNRGSWKMGRIQETISSADGHVRRVKLVLANSSLSSKPSVLERPIHKLVLLLENDPSD